MTNFQINIQGLTCIRDGDTVLVGGFGLSRGPVNVKSSGLTRLM